MPIDVDGAVIANVVPGDPLEGRIGHSGAQKIRADPAIAADAAAMTLPVKRLRRLKPTHFVNARCGPRRSPDPLTRRCVDRLRFGGRGDAPRAP